MAAISSSKLNSSQITYDLKHQIRQHEVAIEELNNITSSRSVYVKKSNIFFRTSIESAITFEKGQLDVAKRKMQNLDNK